MPEYLEKPGKADKVVPIICGFILLAFLISLPFMVRDEARIKAEKWQQQGCQMYDDERAVNVPAKCNNDFTDHYKAQTPRVQPPEVRGKPMTHQPKLERKQ